jgi:hypothetical protein
MRMAEYVALRRRAPRHCERSEAIQLLFQRPELDCIASLAMTADLATGHRTPLPRDDAS